MQSSNVAAHPYMDQVLKYPQIAILKSDKVDIKNNKGKFVIPSITPLHNNTDAVDKQLPSPSSSRIINASARGGIGLTESNYIELEIPKHLFPIKEIKITPNASKDDGYYVSCSPKAEIIYEEFLKDKEFIGVYIGGSQFKFKIIGVV